MLLPHVEDEQLDLYALGRLSAEQLAHVEEHLLVCDSCRARLRASDEFAALFCVAATHPEARRAPVWRRFWRRPIGVAVAAAAMATVLFIATRPEAPVAAPAIIAMQSMRGPDSAVEVESNRPVVLVFDVEHANEAQIVDPEGKEVLRAPTSQADGRAALRIGRLSRGSYWVRVYRERGGDPIAEYGLRAR